MHAHVYGGLVTLVFELSFPERLNKYLFQSVLLKQMGHCGESTYFTVLGPTGRDYSCFALILRPSLDACKSIDLFGYSSFSISEVTKL
jgi:hypothetical protein